jgi:biotin carboxylase
MTMHVIFVAPFAMETTMRFVRAAASLPDVRLAVISQEPRERFEQTLGDRLHGFHRVKDPLDPSALVAAVRAIALSDEVGSESAWEGRVDCLLGVLEQLQEPLAIAREELGIRGMDKREATNFRDKSVMKDVLREHGIPCARHYLATSSADALAFANEILPLVAKPPAGAGARNTVRVETKEQLASYLRTLPPSASQPLLLEEFIVGEEHSFDSVSVGGRHVFHSISRYTPTPLQVMENPWVQWCVVLPRHIDGDEYQDIFEAGARTLDALGMVTGVTHMEWFRRPDGTIAISEVAARPPGAQFTTLLSYAHNVDFYVAWAHLSVFEKFEPPSRSHAVGAVFLRGQGSGTDTRVARVEGIDEVQKELGDLVVAAKIPAPGSPASKDYEGEGYVILRHTETEAVETGLARVLELIKIRLG